jgi:hypothetical protein
MAFPGTYNFNYYKGDTFEFRVYPKDSVGAVFDLATFPSVAFTISTSRGLDGVEDQIEGFAEISEDNTYILCTVTPSNGANMTAGVQYVYDIEIAKTGIDYNIVYTLLTGTINVTDQVTGA